MSHPTSRESIYAVYKILAGQDNDWLRAIFPDTSEGCQAAIAWGKDQYGEDFNAAYSARLEPGQVYLTKCHGVEVFYDE